MNKFYKIIYSIFTSLFILSSSNVFAQPDLPCNKIEHVGNTRTIGNGTMQTCITNNGMNVFWEDDTNLPVEFLYFKAQPDTKFIKLEWATASEINNAFFSVEYSRDGIGYKEIGRVAGHGNSVETIEYDFMHETPLVGENFYRLRQQDFDGTFEYSEVAQIQLEGDQNISIRPNLVKGELTVVVNKGYEKDTEAVIYDLVGAAVKTVTFPANTAAHTFELEDLPNGHYFFHLKDGLTSHVGRFVKTADY